MFLKKENNWWMENLEEIDLWGFSIVFFLFNSHQSKLEKHCNLSVTIRRFSWSCWLTGWKYSTLILRAFERGASSTATASVHGHLVLLTVTSCLGSRGQLCSCSLFRCVNVHVQMLCGNWDWVLNTSHKC